MNRKEIKNKLTQANLLLGEVYDWYDKCPEEEERKYDSFDVGMIYSAIIIIGKVVEDVKKQIKSKTRNNNIRLSAIPLKSSSIDFLSDSDKFVEIRMPKLKLTELLPPARKS